MAEADRARRRTLRHRGPRVAYHPDAKQRVTGRLVYADADQPGHRTRDRRCQADLDFLAKARTADLDALLVMWRNHDQKKAPAWKRVVLRRAIEREQTRARQATSSSAEATGPASGTPIPR